MKNLAFFTVLFLFCLPTVLHAQWKRETGFSIGVVIPNFPKDYQNDEKVGVSTKFGFNQSWYKPEKKFSFRPEAGGSCHTQAALKKQMNLIENTS